MRKLLSTLCLAFLAGTTSVAALAVESVQKDAATQSAAVAGKVNLNSADADTLARELVGIGASKAQAIVAHREAHGPFATVDELPEVKGIGTAILEKNLNRLSVQEAVRGLKSRPGWPAFSWGSGRSGFSRQNSKEPETKKPRLASGLLNLAPRPGRDGAAERASARPRRGEARRAE